MKATAYVDGRGNAGDQGSCACVVYSDDGGEHERSKLLGGVTNNEAEYEGVILALDLANELGINSIEIFSDSQLIVNQVLGLYRVKQAHLVPFRDRVWEMGQQFEHVGIRWVPREENKRADKLCRDALKPPTRSRPAPLSAKKNPFAP